MYFFIEKNKFKINKTLLKETRLYTRLFFVKLPNEACKHIVLYIILPIETLRVYLLICIIVAGINKQINAR